jgi:uncharacterized glyoxalase superfamily protein PhnB
MATDIFVAPDIVPFLRYKDAAAAIEWLEEVLGFETVVRFDKDDGAVDYSVLRFGTGAIQISSPRGGEVERPAHTMGLGGLYIVVDDPDGLHDRARDAGARIVRGLTDEEYGSREFTVRDPEGNDWSFGTYRPGAH